MTFHAKDPNSGDIRQVIIPLACSTFAAIFLDESFSIHHEGHGQHFSWLMGKLKLNSDRAGLD